MSLGVSSKHVPDFHPSAWVRPGRSFHSPMFAKPGSGLRTGDKDGPVPVLPHVAPLSALCWPVPSPSCLDHFLTSSRNASSVLCLSLPLSDCSEIFASVLAISTLVFGPYLGKDLMQFTDWNGMGFPPIELLLSSLLFLLSLRFHASSPPVLILQDGD